MAPAILVLAEEDVVQVESVQIHQFQIFQPLILLAEAEEVVMVAQEFQHLLLKMVLLAEMELLLLNTPINYKK